MKRLSLAILCCFLLSGCIFDPVFDTSSWDAYQRSSAAIRTKLGNDDLRRLDIALKYLVVESMPGNAFEGPYGDANMRGALANPYVILGQLGPRIDGRSAARDSQRPVWTGARFTAHQCRPGFEQPVNVERSEDEDQCVNRDEEEQRSQRLMDGEARCHRIGCP